MAALFALGVMSVGWMAFIAALIATEKLLPWKALANRGIAVLLLVLGLAVAFTPGDVPGLTLPNSAEARQAMQSMGMEEGESMGIRGGRFDRAGGDGRTKSMGSAAREAGHARRVDGLRRLERGHARRPDALTRSAPLSSAQNSSSLDHSNGMCLARAAGPIPLEAEPVRLVLGSDPVSRLAPLVGPASAPGMFVTRTCSPGRVVGPVITSAWPSTIPGTLRRHELASSAISSSIGANSKPSSSPKHVLGKHLRPAPGLPAEDRLQRLALSIIGALVHDQPIALGAHVRVPDVALELGDSRPR